MFHYQCDQNYYHSPVHYYNMQQAWFLQQQQQVEIGRFGQQALLQHHQQQLLHEERCTQQAILQCQEQMIDMQQALLHQHQQQQQVGIEASMQQALLIQRQQQLERPELIIGVPRANEGLGGPVQADLQQAPVNRENELQGVRARARAEARKRKIDEIIKCKVCLATPQKGHILQCQNGHLICQGCMDKNEESESDDDGNESNTRRVTCPTCRTPMNQLTGNKRIRALGIEQLIEAIDVDLPCIHMGCEFVAPKSAMPSHERKCEYRKISCPHLQCNQDRHIRRVVPFHGFLHHMMENHNLPVVLLTTTHRVFEIINPAHNIFGQKGSILVKFQDKHFLVARLAIEGTCHSFLYILGNIEEAKEYTAIYCTDNKDDSPKASFQMTLL